MHVSLSAVGIASLNLETRASYLRGRVIMLSLDLFLIYHMHKNTHEPPATLQILLGTAA
jgi:hypothetical protein